MKEFMNCTTRLASLALWAGVAIGVLAYGTADAAVVNFSDSFEGAGFDPFWTVSQSFGTVTTSTDQSFTGVQSAKFESASGGQRSMLLSHDFANPVTGSFSVRYYDFAPGAETLYEKLILENTAQPGWTVGLGTQDFDAFCYTADAIGTGPNQNCGSFPQLSTTNVGRTAGWHLLEIIVGSNLLEMKIDGGLVHSLVGSYSFDRVSFAVSGPSFRPNTTAYIDDFTINATDEVPEPGTLALGSLGLVLLVAARRWRR